MTSRSATATARTSSEARAVARTQTLIKGEHGIGTVRRTTLPGGLRIVTETLPSVRSATFGIWAHVGSRDETPALNGATHYLEHLLFKGTRKRSALDISSAIDAVGGEMNAFTAKEYTCYYARVLDTDLPLAIDVVCDMLTGSLIQEEDVDVERGAILEEIAMTEDDPGDCVHDLFAHTMFGDNALGRRRQVEGLVLGQYGLLQSAQFVAGLEAEVLDEGGPDAVVDGQRVHLAATPVESEHEQARAAFPQWLRLDRGLQFAEDRVVLAAPQLRLQVVLQDIEAAVLHGGEFRPHRAGLDEVGEDGSAPQVEGLSEKADRLVLGSGGKPGPPFGHPAAEQVQIHPVGVDPDHVAGSAGDEFARRAGRGSVLTEHPAQSPDRVLQDLPRGGGRVVGTPQRGQQLAGGHHLVGLQQQVPEGRPLFDAPQRQGLLAGQHLEWTEHPKAHNSPSPARCRILLATTLQTSTPVCQSRDRSNVNTHSTLRRHPPLTWQNKRPEGLGRGIAQALRSVGDPEAGRHEGVSRAQCSGFRD